jgi:hypothetical protein
MKERFAKLIDLKSLITIILVVTLVVIVVCNINIEDEAIKTLFISTITSCFTYFFTKKKDTEGKDNE